MMINFHPSPRVADTSVSVNVRPFKDRRFDAAGQVFVFRNTHTNGWSIKAVDGIYKGLVVGHADSCALYEARFVVNEAGRQRVLREGRKNVHAGIVGTLAPERDWISNTEALRDELFYNPYRTKSFVKLAAGNPNFEGSCTVRFASHVHLGTDGRVRAAGVR